MTTDTPAWLDPNGLRIAGYGLTRHALDQMDERGVTPDQVANAVINPTLSTHPGTGGRGEYANQNITVYTNDRTRTILAVLRFGEVYELAATKPGPLTGTPRRDTPFPRRTARKPRAMPVQRTHVLDAIHPALRAEITRLVDGDFTRLVVHSPTNVEIRTAE